MLVKVTEGIRRVPIQKFDYIKIPPIYRHISKFESEIQPYRIVKIRGTIGFIRITSYKTDKSNLIYNFLSKITATNSRKYKVRSTAFPSRINIKNF